MNVELRGNRERAEVIAKFITFASSSYVFPLYLLFSIADYVWYNQHFYHFLFIRIITVVAVMAGGRIVKKVGTDLLRVQLVSSFFISLCVAPIHYMLFTFERSDSPYYGGLVLIVVGIATGLRFTWKFYGFNMAIIYLPFMAIGIFKNVNFQEGYFLLNTVFFISVGVIATIGKMFFENINVKEFHSRLQLENEIDNRGKIIEEKTRETVKLNSLSKQFSPQVIKSIRDGVIDFESTRSNEICAVFVDIKDSTSRFLTLSGEDLQKIISMYMEDVMGVFLKYDITIDKFLGDGILGFSNDPVKQDDYIERVIRASFEVVTRLQNKEDIYKSIWKSKMDVRIGIATGIASVGFYGSDKHVRAYTALGKVMNLASRVNGIAGVNEIAVSDDVVRKLRDKDSEIFKELNVVDLGNIILRGFEGEKINMFRLENRHNLDAISEDEEVCPSGHGPLFLHKDEHGIYVLKCRYCNFMLENDASQKKVA